LTRVPATNVVPIKTDLLWEDLAAIPESYATALACLHGNLALGAGQTLLIRGATSALGQAALNIAAQTGALVIAATRNRDRVSKLEGLGAKRVVLERQGPLAPRPRTQPRGHRHRLGPCRQQYAFGFARHGTT
jgi:NADPH:quinone reductase-like Zn-dependent oxidoreductase